VNQKHLTKRIIITGTHLTPAIELINQLKNDSTYQWDIFYIGRLYNSSVNLQPSIESQIIPKLNVKFYGITCGKLDRRWLPNTIKGIPQTIKGFFQSQKHVSQIKPDVIISFGGYVSVPVIFNGWLKSIPSITHEQTVTNSLTTKINSFFVKKIALSFNNPSQLNSLPKNKTKFTGNLLRSEIFNISSTLFENLKLKIDKFPLIYITAGNQGSHRINLIIKDLLPQLSNFTIIHQTGNCDFTEFSKLNQQFTNYHAFNYVDSQDIGWVFNNAQIVISRSGANTSQEIVALKKNSILVPLLKSQQGEQQLNANWVKKNQPQNTIIIPETKLNSNTLIDAIKKLNRLKKKNNHPKIHPTNLNILHLIHELV
jgi:UDP-N-acetylglucosamine--N-acetylmuramyl-(pentapeptide) pyrophosphoryl-undecaprenol N-acetylglucosamine transferase